MGGASATQQGSSTAPAVTLGSSAPAMAAEAWETVVARAVAREEEGLKAMRGTGRVPRGPPDLPIGIEIIDVKYVPYLVGKGGNHLVELNTAAGVSIHFDNSTKAPAIAMPIFTEQKRIRFVQSC